jgi:hypothetical protein
MILSARFCRSGGKWKDAKTSNTLDLCALGLRYFVKSGAIGSFLYFLLTPLLLPLTIYSPYHGGLIRRLQRSGETPRTQPPSSAGKNKTRQK